MLERGRIVRALCGRDNGSCFVVMETKDEKNVLLCDGKKRPLERPKLKNVKHLELLDRYVPEESMTTNKLLRRALHDYNYTATGEKKAKMLTKGVSK